MNNEVGKDGMEAKGRSARRVEGVVSGINLLIRINLIGWIRDKSFKG
jgi:hypothetical protein